MARFSSVIPKKLAYPEIGCRFFIPGVLVGVGVPDRRVKEREKGVFHNRTPLEGSAGASSETALVCAFFVSSSLICKHLSVLRSQRGRRGELDLNERPNSPRSHQLSRE